MAKINWQSLIVKTCFWLLIEVMFNFLGIDDIADYSEFLLIPKNTVQSEHLFITR